MSGTKLAIDLNSGEDLDVAALIRKKARRESNPLPQAAFGPARVAWADEKPNEDLKSFFFDPFLLETNFFGNVRTVSPHHGRLVTCRILRRVAEKAWIINLCISTSISQARPYFKEALEDNQRGFRVWNRKAKEAGRDMTDAERKEARRLVDFFLNTGDIDDPNRTDDLDKYATKIIRDLYQLDQISAELQRTRGGELCAFWAVDTATIELALPNTERTTGVKYAQVINHVPYAYYGKDDLIFDMMNPRTDVERAGYGYSIVEQAIDLVTSSINTFMYNSSFFTENRLPRGILLLNGPADQEEIEDIEDYIVNIMSGQPSSQWRVPIIPAPDKAPNGGKMFEWVNLQGSNKDMEFQNWFDLQMSAIAAMFKKSLEELGLHSSKSQPMLERNTQYKIRESKSLGLGDLLTFMQKHFNQILRHKNPDYVFEFVGYEMDDIKLMTDIDKAELDSWKTLNEKRLEKGVEPLDMGAIKNPADLPLNVQAVQLWQSQQGMGGGMGGSPFDMDDDDGFGDDAGEAEGMDEGDAEEPQSGDWGDIEAQSGGGVQKSLGSRGAVRVDL